MHEATFQLPAGGTRGTTTTKTTKMTTTTTPTTTATTTTTTTTTTTSKQNAMTTTAQYEIGLAPDKFGNQAKSMVISWAEQTGSMFGARSTSL